jgi:hypothetical protein
MTPISSSEDRGADGYVIASLKHTHKHHEHITFWGPGYRGYVLALTEDRVGFYSAAHIAKDNVLNDGVTCIAVPWEAVKPLLSPTPFYGTSRGTCAQFYDIPGPVVNNTRENWSALIAASMPRESKVKVKPEVFKGQRRSFALPDAAVAALTQAGARVSE